MSAEIVPMPTKPADVPFPKQAEAIRRRIALADSIPEAFALFEELNEASKLLMDLTNAAMKKCNELSMETDRASGEDARPTDDSRA